MFYWPRKAVENFFFLAFLALSLFRKSLEKVSSIDVIFLDTDTDTDTPVK